MLVNEKSCRNKNLIAYKYQTYAAIGVGAAAPVLSALLYALLLAYADAMVPNIFHVDWPF